MIADICVVLPSLHSMFSSYIHACIMVPLISNFMLAIVPLNIALHISYKSRK